jgi:hypothetical protein
MLLRLTERLDIPQRKRNTLLLAAGFAPAYPGRDLDKPALGAARQAVQLVLAGHKPYPADAVERHSTIVASNHVARPRQRLLGRLATSVAGRSRSRAFGQLAAAEARRGPA